MKFQEVTYRIQVRIKNAKTVWLEGADPGVIAERDVSFILPVDIDDYLSISVANSLYENEKSLAEDVVVTETKLIGTEERSEKEYKAFMQRNGRKTRR